MRRGSNKTVSCVARRLLCREFCEAVHAGRAVDAVGTACVSWPPADAPVAQLDRVLASEAKGRAFEPRRARQSNQGPTTINTNNVTGGAALGYGSVGTLADGRKFVRFERHLAHSIASVWAAITEPAQLVKWFPGLQLELKEGGRFSIWFGGGCEGPAHVTGTVRRFEPPHVLECGSIRFELEEARDGCLLRFSDILMFEASRSDADITNSVLGGWHRFLDALEEALSGKAVDHDQPEFDYASIEVTGRD